LEGLIEKKGGPGDPPGILIYFFFGFAAFLAGTLGAALPVAAILRLLLRKLGTFFAAILISLPVRGFLPFLPSCLRQKMFRIQ